MQTNIEERKIELIQWLSVIDDAVVIDRIRTTCPPEPIPSRPSQGPASPQSGRPA